MRVLAPFLNRYYVRRTLGEDLVLRIDPKFVHYHVGSNQPLTHSMRDALSAYQRGHPLLLLATGFANKVLYSLEPFLVGQRIFDRRIPIQQEERYKIMNDFIANKNEIERSLWFGILQKSLHSQGRAFYKSIELDTEEAILRFLKIYVGSLVESLQSTGYDESKASDVPTVFIDRDGSIQKSDAGNHRFAAAKVLGVGIIPVEVLAVHWDWYRRTVGRNGMNGLRSALQKVEASNRS